MSVGEEEELYIPPPEPPPPRLAKFAEFAAKVQLFTVGAEETMYMPPPLPLPAAFALPPVTVKPSRIVAASTPMAVTTC